MSEYAYARLMRSKEPKPKFGFRKSDKDIIIQDFGFDTTLIVYMRGLHAHVAESSREPGAPFCLSLSDRELCLWRNSCLAGSLREKTGGNAIGRYAQAIKWAQDAEAAGDHIYFTARW